MSNLFGGMFDDDAPQGQKREEKREQYRNDKAERADPANLYLMPFGKHKGEAVLKLPASYLAWLYWDFQQGTKPLTGHLLDNVVKGLRSYNINIEGDKPFFPKSN